MINHDGEHWVCDQCGERYPLADYKPRKREKDNGEVDWLDWDCYTNQDKAASEYIASRCFN